MYQHAPISYLLRKSFLTMQHLLWTVGSQSEKTKEGIGREVWEGRYRKDAKEGSSRKESWEQGSKGR
jgi:hypothetical protein